MKSRQARAWSLAKELDSGGVSKPVVGVSFESGYSTAIARSDLLRTETYIAPWKLRPKPLGPPGFNQFLFQRRCSDMKVSKVFH